MKQTIIFIITILILLILGVGIYMKNNTEKQLSKDDFISLMNSFENVSNVKLEGSSIKYIKDGVMLVIEKSGLYTWSDSKTKECIRYSPSDKQYAMIKYGESDFSDLEKSEYTFIRT